MIETQIEITVNRKSDIEQIQQKIVESKIQFPVYIREYELSYQISFSSDYEEWELDKAILECFSGYEFTSYLERGKKEIRIEISRYQSEFSTDGWGRPIENPLNETKYLVKKSKDKPQKFNPIIKVLFEETEQDYYVNITGGINKATNEQGFLLLNEFRAKNENNNAEILKDKLYQTPLDAFHAGYNKMHVLVDTDFSVYLENKRKEIREIQKIPRKIIRNFIKACNSFNEKEILKNMSENIVFEKRKNWQTIFSANGIDGMKEYINSATQSLCSRDFTIRPSWNFNLPIVTIGVKYFPISDDPEIKQTQKYGQIIFTLEDYKIVRIIEEY
ncbi:hypothetical protein M8998_05470 [Sphingobacterium sp. lm-10]|uniref:hypothetical protein n=1 Tax=Sphingobacterium sp. lm-10 TaxID=2944904 RepID=UPI002021A202|nr:hypothetical protein [Sphingobacterium sp. lm-10]MCL7987386.1 hypothetical protein [Sphingobacterium sp. lm-10]